MGCYNNVHEYLNLLGNIAEMPTKITKNNFVEKSYKKAIHPRSTTDNNSVVRFLIVTPVLNGISFLDETIRSVIFQEGDFFIEYIIKDNNSTDGSYELVEDWIKRIHKGDIPLYAKGMSITLYSSKDQGLYDGISIGFEIRPYSDNDILSYLNADDILLPKALHTVKTVFFMLPSSSWFIGQPMIIDEHGDVLSTSAFPLSYNQQDVAAGMHDGRKLGFIQQEGTFWRASLYKLVGGLDRTLSLAGDYDLWRRFALHVEPLSFNRSLGAFRKHHGQLSAGLDAYYQEVDDILVRKPFHSTLNGVNQSITTLNREFYNTAWKPYPEAHNQKEGAVLYFNDAMDRFEVIYTRRCWFGY